MPSDCSDAPQVGTTGTKLNLGYVGDSMVFLSSATTNGAIDGLAGADQFCQGLADAANLSGIFKAWLSDSTTSAGERLVHSPGPYVRTDGTQVATNWDDLVDGAIEAQIGYDENGAEVLVPDVTWTATDDDGTSQEPFCDDWTSADGGVFGAGGDPTSVDFWWSYSGDGPCNFARPLYCVQQL